MARTEIHYSGKESKTFPNGGEQITLLDGRMKYKFSTTKKDGGTTKAYESWQKLNPKIGDILPAEVNEEQKEFQDQNTGKTVKYTDRRVMYFYTDHDSMTVANTPKHDAIPVVGSSAIDDRLKAIEDRISALEQKNEQPTIQIEEEEPIELDSVPF